MEDEAQKGLSVSGAKVRRGATLMPVEGGLKILRSRRTSTM
jgi:hypothetical protein